MSSCKKPTAQPDAFSHLLASLSLLPFHPCQSAGVLCARARGITYLKKSQIIYCKWMLLFVWLFLFTKTCKVLALIRTGNTMIYKLICLPRNSVDFLRPNSGKELSVVKLGIAPMNTWDRKKLSGLGKDVGLTAWKRELTAIWQYPTKQKQPS